MSYRRLQGIPEDRCLLSAVVTKLLVAISAIPLGKVSVKSGRKKPEPSHRENTVLKISFEYLEPIIFHGPSLVLKSFEVESSTLQVTQGT